MSNNLSHISKILREMYATGLLVNIISELMHLASLIKQGLISKRNGRSCDKVGWLAEEKAEFDRGREGPIREGGGKRTKVEVKKKKHGRE